MGRMAASIEMMGEKGRDSEDALKWTTLFLLSVLIVWYNRLCRVLHCNGKEHRAPQ